MLTNNPFKTQNVTGQPALKLVLAFLLSITSVAASAQAEQAEQAAQAVQTAPADPLFADPAPLAITLIAPFEQIDDERDKDQEYRGTLTYTGSDGEPVVLDARFEVRGNWRLSKSNCSYSQLWVICVVVSFPAPCLKIKIASSLWCSVAARVAMPTISNASCRPIRFSPD